MDATLQQLLAALYQQDQQTTHLSAEVTRLAAENARLGAELEEAKQAASEMTQLDSTKHEPAPLPQDEDSAASLLAAEPERAS